MRYLSSVKGGGKKLPGAVTGRKINTSTADDVELSNFISDWEESELAELGIYLINNGNKMRIAKGMYEIRVKDASDNGEKDTAIRFPRPQDEFKPLDLTYHRAAIITARAVARVL